MMLYKSNRFSLYSHPNSDTDSLDVVTGIFQGDTLAPILFIISQDYLLRMSADPMKENSSKLKKATSKEYQIENLQVL